MKNYWNTHLNKKSILGKRKTIDNEDNETLGDSKKPSQSHNSQPIFSTSPKRTTEVLDFDEKKEEVKEEINVRDSTWMERAVQFFNYDYDMVETPVMMHPNYSNFVFDEDPFTSYLDSFLLFEAFGKDSDVGVQSFLP